MPNTVDDPTTPALPACAPASRSTLGDVEAVALATRLKALAHPVRLRMVDLIHQHGGEICVCEFEHHFDLKQPTISHHLKILREAGLIRSRQEGSWVHHFVEPGAFSALGALMDGFAARAQQA